jgi:hypothetical protein
MSYIAKIDGFEGQNIEVKVSFWSGPKLLLNGKPATKGTKRGEMVLQRADGTQATASWKQQLLGLDVPQLVVDGNVISLVEPLTWYQWVWGGWPVLLLFIGGALGALAGLMSLTINAKVFRTDMNVILKYVVSGIVSVLSVGAYFVAATIFTLLINQ